MFGPSELPSSGPTVNVNGDLKIHLEGLARELASIRGGDGDLGDLGPDPLEEAGVNFGNLLSRLLREPSFVLQRLSPATFPNDVVTTQQRQGKPLTKTEAAAVIALMKGGSCYRCRVAKGPFRYASTPGTAIRSALGS